MRMVILGPPGAGKGTQAARIAERYAIPAISTGEIFRANIRQETPLGKQVKDILATGGYVTDDITNAIVKDRLLERDAQAGFLLDGYPRTVAQVEALDAILAEQGRGIDTVLQLTVDEEAVVQRLLKRAQIEGRVDDTEKVIRERQAIYRAETAPLAQDYASRGLLVQADGMGDVDDVSERIAAVLDQR